MPPDTPTVAPMPPGTLRRLASGTIPDMNRAAGESNRLQLVVCGSDGYFFVNGSYVATLDLSEHQEAGDITLSTDFDGADVQESRRVTFTDFQVELVDCGTGGPTLNPTATAIPGVPVPTATVFGVSASTPTELSGESRARLFTTVWQTVKDHYLYPDFHGADWDSIRQTYETRAEAATNAPAYYAVLNDMIKQLKDNHSHYLAPWDARDEAADIQGNTSYAGIGVAVADDSANGQRIMYVFPGGGAAAAGLRRRDVMVGLNGQKFTDNAGWSSKIRGPVDTTVLLSVRSPGQAPRDVVVTRRHITGNIAPTGSRLTADPTIGYMVLPDLEAKGVPAEFEAQLRAMLAGGPLHGIVLDLRSNQGGLISVAQGVLSQFVTGQVGSFARRTGNTPLLVTKGALYDQLKTVPLVVLVDHQTKSAAEMLTGALQAAGRARVVGEPTAGTTEELFPFDFADGSRLWLAEAAFELPNGEKLEGHGVPLNAQVNVDWINYPERDDPQILKAIEHLRRPAHP
ncbi:MAG: S41 family peptidase [Chloroflexia bacterium]